VKALAVQGNAQQLAGQGLSTAANEDLSKLLPGVEHYKSFHKPLSLRLFLRQAVL